jgi:hypothetical protein
VSGAAFYCVADERYFLGAVGLVNSLRLVGHTEPIYLLDCGLAPEQRELISPEVTLVRDQSETPPWLLKTIAPLRHPAEVMVLIDADMVVTRRLDPLIEQARAGAVVAVRHGQDRFCPEWGELLGIGTVRRQPYVSSGLVAVAREPGDRVLSLMNRLQEKIDFDRSLWRGNDPYYPFLYGDQDVLNAILASDAAGSEIVALDRRLEAIPPFTGLEVIDRRTLRCRYGDGLEPLELHHYSAKPWLRATPEGPYTVLLRRLLLGSGLAVRPPRKMLPHRLRDGIVGATIRDWVSGRGIGTLRRALARGDGVAA